MVKKIAIIAAFAMLGTTFAVSVHQRLAVAEPAQNIKRTPVQKFDVPDSKYETVVAIAELGPNVIAGRHTHPGPESSYVLDGELVLMVQGKPDQTYKAGQAFNIPAGTPHDAKAGANGVKILATYIVEKGKPLATPAK